MIAKGSTTLSSLFAPDLGVLDITTMPHPEIPPLLRSLHSAKRLKILVLLENLDILAFFKAPKKAPKISI
ncbi:MAG: hypothetical protein COB16_03910 [Rhodobacteraceae bacterium]|nr:MAG: hypothetical protein COB16_03910 [Paracoccaceae bacterium]